MKLSILTSICFSVASTLAAPGIIAVPERSFDLTPLEDRSPAVAEYTYEIMEMFDKRDSESTIETILKQVNSSGIIFELLDSIADDPAQIKGLANYTELLLSKVNISSLVSSAMAGGSSANVSGILGTVQDSGLLTSMLDGTLLDPDFQPVIAHLIERVVRANEDVILYAFTALVKPANSNSKRADSTSNSLSSFAGNIAGSLLGSALVQSALGDTLNALNDTGIALYVTKRFLSTERYINMTATLFNDIVASGAIPLNELTSLAGSLNITSIIEKQLENPEKLVNLVTGILSGKTDFSAISSSLGKYNSGLKSIIKILEKDGLFVELNDLLFPESSTSSSSSASATKKEAKKDQMTSSVTTATTSVTASATASKTSHAGSPGMYQLPSYFMGALLGGMLLL